MLGRLAIFLAYQLEGSKAFKRWKRIFHNLVENPRSRMRPYFDLFMMVLVTLSVFLYIYEVKHGIDTFGRYFELFAVSLFVCEYLVRLWLCDDSHKTIIEHYEKTEFLDLRFRLWPALRQILLCKWRYATTPFAIIDLLAILPAYQSLPILRVFILLRLFKLLRYAHSINEFIRVLSEKRFELYTLAFFLGFVTFASSTAMYVFEGEVNGGQIKDFSDAVYWSFVTLFTVGYGDITPQTPEGRGITFLLVVSGVGLVAFLTSLLITAFAEKMDELRESRVYAEVEKLKDVILVCGYGRMGQVVVKKLLEDKVHFVIIDRDRERVALAKKRGFLVIMGDASSNEILVKLGIRDRVTTVLSLTGDDVHNVYITLTAHHLNPKLNIISRANKPESARKLEQAGADHVIQPFEIVGLTVAEYVGQPVAFEAVYGMASGDRHFRIEAVLVREGSILDEAQISEIRFEKKRLILFGIIGAAHESRNGLSGYSLRSRFFYFNPAGDFRLHANDILVVFGHEYSINHFKETADKGRLKLSRKTA
ncbi:MAG: potassium channel protein [Methylococcaceae bacterium]|nr:MAG: potassium channel protein [Methylococcaceae bacterium]